MRKKSAAMMIPFMTLVSLYADTHAEDELFNDTFLKEFTQPGSSKALVADEDWTNTEKDVYPNKLDSKASKAPLEKYPSEKNEVMAAQPFVGAGTHFSVYGEYLYWISGINNTIYSSKGNNTNSELTRNLKGFDNQYSSGSRFGLAAAFSPQGWDLDLVWTRLHQGVNSRAKKPTDLVNSLFITWGSAYNGGTTESSILQQKGHWKMDFDEIDFTMGKEFFVSKWFALHPSAGFRQIWLKSGFSIKNTDVTGATLCDIRENNSWNAFGLKVGLDSAFHLGWGFSIDSMFNVALVYGKNNVTYTPSSSTTTPFAGITASGNDNSEKFFSLIPVIDLGLGLSWADTFYDDTFGLTLGAGYEYHLLVDAFVPVSIVSNNGIEITLERPTSLYMHGLVASLKLGF